MSSHFEALGFTLVHFCWQAMILAAVYRLAELTAPRMRNQSRYALGLVLMLAMLFVAAATFIYEENRLSAVPDLAVAAPFLPTATPNLTLAAFLPWLDAAWVMGVIALSVRMAGSLWFINKLSKYAQPVPESVANRFAHAARRLGLGGKVRIRLHPAINGPFVIGALRSVVYLPVSALTTLDPDQLDAVLAHELEHIRRADYVWNLVQSLIETLFFFHPTVWWLGAKLRDQRELCCDDAALRTCQDPLIYATALLSLEEQRREPRLAMALNGEGSGRSLMSRIARMLGEKSALPRVNPTQKVKPAAALALPVVLIVLAAFVTPVARITARVQQDILPPAANSDDKFGDTKISDKKNCPINTPAFKARMATVKARQPGISDEEAIKIVQASLGDDANIDSDNNDVTDFADIDPDAIAAQARADVERSRADIARARATSIDPQAIAEQARQGALQAKRQMERQGWASDIDVDAVAAQARAEAERARDQLTAMKDVQVDADAVAAQAKAAAISARASYSWADSAKSWQRFGQSWSHAWGDTGSVSRDRSHRASTSPRAPRSPTEPVGGEVQAPLMDAPTPPSPPAAPLSQMAPVAPLAPLASVAPVAPLTPIASTRVVTTIKFRAPAVQVKTHPTPQALIMLKVSPEARISTDVNTRAEVVLVTTRD